MKILSRHFWGSFLHHRTFPYIGSSVKVSVHEFHTFLAISGCTY
jgi:hypothetical protein